MKKITGKNDSLFVSLQTPDTISISSETLKTILFPGSNNAVLRTISKDGLIETKSKNFDIDVDSIEIKMTLEAIHFMPNTSQPLISRNVNLFRIASYIGNLSEGWRLPLNIQLEAVSDSSGSILAKVEEQLLSMLLLNLNLKDDQDLEKWMEKREITLTSTIDTIRVSDFPFVEIHLEAKGEK